MRLLQSWRHADPFQMNARPLGWGGSGQRQPAGRIHSLGWRMWMAMPSNCPMPQT